ncbi:hypothetical protein AS159_00535 [Thermotoga sp. Ku-13t]|uniref:DUF1611 domain-containing protein n=1 Tax=Thermotoga sp. Ku-13t TaxID=1755813 RepID=UPI0013EDA0BE|nr:DUF1611 domain-containing protein [Thermotoga sp. Ku-13t]KAF2958242.1 hypothetical protein AS159_00535 [Thermotoga sp. Ku-13t]
MRITDFFEPGTPAAVLAWGQFETTLAKTAHGLLRHSRVLVPVCVVAEHAGKKASDFIRPVRYDVPIVDNMEDAQRLGARVLVIGIASVGGYLPPIMRKHVLDAIHLGMDVVSGLHSKLSETEPFRSAANEKNVKIIDVRHYRGELSIFRGDIFRSKTVRIAVLGTDCATGKRTTAVQLYEFALKKGLPAAFLATGQTGIMLGADEGVAIDALPADFIPGVLERLILKLESEGKRFIFIEGQGALRHPAYGQVTLGLIYGSMPQISVLVHDPRRKRFEYFEHIDTKPDLDAEIELIQKFVNTKILGISCLDENFKHALYPVFNPFDENQIEKIFERMEAMVCESNL